MTAFLFIAALSLTQRLLMAHALRLGNPAYSAAAALLGTLADAFPALLLYWLARRYAARRNWPGRALASYTAAIAVLLVLDTAYFLVTNNRIDGVLLKNIAWLSVRSHLVSPYPLYAVAALAACGALVMDIYGQFLGMMVGEIGYPPEPLRGRFHSMGGQSDYYLRINAVNFALAADDGLSVEKYQRADLILVGVSRSGKTPTSLYMAMQYGLNVANYPLTPENFDSSSGIAPGLPQSLLPHKAKLRGLTLAPERLAQIRSERRPNSVYSSLKTCREELRLAEKMLTDAGVPIVDSSTRSVEEIAALIKQSLKPSQSASPAA